ncbi:MAG: hypothetical protein U0822_18215 [Anaerolineae bacterium]
MRSLVVACLVAFALGAGVAVAYRMQTEALAVVVGVICGVGVTIPVSLLIIYASRSARDEPKPPPSAPPAQQPQQTPQIIVVSPSLPHQNGQWPYPTYPATDPGALARPSRDFTIIGDDD